MRERFTDWRTARARDAHAAFSAMRQHWQRLGKARVAVSIGLFALLFTGVFASAAFLTHAGAQGGRTILRGHLVPGLQHAALKRATAGDRALDLTITLAPRNRGQLDALLAAQSDRHSPLYHHYLTPQEYTARFAPTQADVDAVVAYLKGQGLAVRSVAGNRLAIHAAGSVAAAEQAFAVHLGDYTYQGRAVYAPTDEPSVPANLGAIVQGIVGLDNVALYHSHAQRPDPKGVQPRGGSGPGGGYAPSDLRTAYDMNPLINTQGMDGTGQTVAIFELDGYDSTDVDTYLSFYGLGAPKYSNVLVDGATNTPGPGAIEVELDMEVVSAVAPGATQKIYIGPNTGLGVFDTYSRIVSDNLAKVVSTSWGLCEQDSGTSFLDALHSIYQQAAAQGQAIFAASGDDGAFDCARSATGGTVLAVDSPADDPFVIGVGGTTLTTGVGGTYIGETVWSDSVHAQGGGGGLSTHFARPSYQTGPGTTNSFSNGKRQVPDISANADPNTGYSEFCTAGSICAGAGFIVIGGTSAAAPLWAGIAADVNQYLSNPAFGMPTLGEGHTSLYTIFNHTEPQAAYHDITSGNNLHYPATAGYDLATGIGTPDVWNLAQDLTIPIPHIQPSQPGVALATTPGVSPGAVTLTLSNTGLGPLNWSQTAALPAWLSLDATSGSIAMGASQTLTLTFSIPPADPAQTYFTTLTFTDPHADNAPVSVPVTVVATGAASTTWYFAEGTTNSGFNEFLTLANPGASLATVQVKYLLGVGAPIIRSYPVAAHSRATVNVNTELGAGQNVAMVVTSDQPIIAERPMFFTFRGTIPSGTDVLGATALASSFDFDYLDTTVGPAPATHSTWLVLLNQNAFAVDERIAYFPSGGGAATVITHTVPANSRGTIEVARDVPAGRYSALVTLTQSGTTTAADGLVERVLYQVDSVTGLTGAAAIVGVPAPRASFFFAEGFTTPGPNPRFSERYILSNPCATPDCVGAATATATLTFQKVDGTTVSKVVPLAPGQQQIVDAASVLGAGAVSNSASVTSDQPILAERFMSFHFAPAALGGNAAVGATEAIGAAAPHNLFYFAEGTTNPGFAEFLTIQNPDPTQTATVTVTLLPTTGAPVVRVLTVGPHSRFTLDVNSVLSGQSLSLVVESNVPIVAERPLYFDFRGTLPGGTDVVGYQP